MQDDLGTRIKKNYENRTRFYLPRRTNTIIRLDGKAFHSFVKGFNKPFDEHLIDVMQQTAVYLCQNIQGAKLAYIQSDEISILLTDYDNIQTDAWFDGNVQKMASISASLATAKFNQLINTDKLAQFDSRVFVIPDDEEVVNYFLWRQQDASRNSVQMVARSLYSHRECFNKNNSQLQDMIMEKGLNWNDFPTHQKRGSCIYKIQKDVETDDGDIVRRNCLTIDREIPIFSKDRNYIKKWMYREK